MKTLEIASVSDLRLSLQESKKLSLLEERVEQGFRRFFDVGAALEQIRESRLYREEWRTWESYCEDKWGMSKDAADNLINASRVLTNLNESGIPTIVGILPNRESQCRPLAQLPPQLQSQVWKEAVQTAPEGKVTAKHVADVATAVRLETDRNEAYKRATKLVGDCIAKGSGIPKSADDVYQWADENKVNLSPRQRAALRKDVETALRAANSQPFDKAVSAGTSSSSPVRPTKPDKPLEIASALTSYGVKDLAMAVTAMANSRKAAIAVALISALDKKAVPANLREAGITEDEARAISTAFYDVSISIDEEFNLEYEEA